MRILVRELGVSSYILHVNVFTQILLPTFCVLQLIWSFFFILKIQFAQNLLNNHQLKK